MPEVIFAGPEGRLEGRYSPSDDPNAPCALILSPHPKAGGHMDHRITVAMYEQYKRRGFSVLRFNFRGIGRSMGVVTSENVPAISYVIRSGGIL